MSNNLNDWDVPNKDGYVKISSEINSIFEKITTNLRTPPISETQRGVVALKILKEAQKVFAVSESAFPLLKVSYNALKKENNHMQLENNRLSGEVEKLKNILGIPLKKTVSKKIVYIAHPIAGNIQENVGEILRIVKHVNLENDDVLPFAPYVVDVLAMDDTIPEQRAKGIANNTALFEAGWIDEVWLYGDRISSGMQGEIEMALTLNIPVVIASEKIARNPVGPDGKDYSKIILS